MTVVDRSVYKPGTCFNPDKVRFGTEEAAQEAADNMTRKRGKPISVYACGRHWHLTSKVSV